MTPRQLPDYLPADWPDYAEIPTADEWAVAMEEERIAARAFHQMRNPRSQSPTPESIAAGEAHLAEALKKSAADIVRQIEKKQLLTAEEFCAVLEVDVDWLDEALYECRVFAITGPGGRSYYPAFYADPSLKRQHVEQVTRTLAPLSPLSQYRYYLSIRTSLGATPLEALRAGRLDEVITAAMRAAVHAPQRVPSVVEVLSDAPWPPIAPPQHDPSQSFADVLKGVKRR